jgi:hypothetical protein
MVLVTIRACLRQAREVETFTVEARQEGGGCRWGTIDNLVAAIKLVVAVVRLQLLVPSNTRRLPLGSSAARKGEHVEERCSVLGIFWPGFDGLRSIAAVCVAHRRIKQVK